MELYQPEWVQQFGAKMRAEGKVRIRDPLPEAIVAKLRAIEDTEQRLRTRRERTPEKR